MSDGATGPTPPFPCRKGKHYRHILSPKQNRVVSLKQEPARLHEASKQTSIHLGCRRMKKCAVCRYCTRHANAVRVRRRTDGRPTATSKRKKTLGYIIGPSAVVAVTHLGTCLRGPLRRYRTIYAPLNRICAFLRHCSLF